MKKRKIIVTTLLLCLTIGSVTANAKTNQPEIPDSVNKKIEQKIEQNKDVLPEITAYTIDENGNKVKVQPKDSITNTDVSTLAIPNDGYIYRFKEYVPNTTITRNWYYANAGTFRFNNTTSSMKADVTYTQQATTEKTWNVTANISGETTIGNGFLAGVKASAGIEVSRNKTWSKGYSYSTAIDVPARTVAYITNYQVAAKSTGELVYTKYTPTGTMCGYYRETAGGSAIDLQDVNIELSDTAPL